MDARDALIEVRASTAMNRTQLARLAGVSPSTISRIENGQLEPTWATMNKIFIASGCRPVDTLSSAGDVSAVAAARCAFGELRGFELPAGSQLWRQRWERAGFMSPDGRALDVARVGLLAGLAAEIFDRPNERVDVAYDRDWQALAQDLDRAGIPYAVTGITATRSTRATDGAWWPILYVEDVQRATSKLGLIPPVDGEGRFSLFEFDSISREGAVRDGDFAWVSPGQALIDSYAGPGRMADKADSAAALLQRAMVAA